MKSRKSITTSSRMWILSLVILLAVLPVAVYAALSKSSAINVIDEWQEVAPGTLVVGNAEDVSGSYQEILFVEIAHDSNAQSGVDVIIEISYADDQWVELISFKGTAETAAATTLNDGAATAGDTTITLTDATTGDFDVPSRKWFIQDGTVANSEAVRTVSNSTHTVILCQDLLRNHADGIIVTDRVDEWPIWIPMAASYVRTLINNTDADASLHFTTRDMRVDGL